MAPRFSQEWVDYFIPETVAWHPDGMPDLDKAVMKNLVIQTPEYPHGVPDADTLHRYEGIATYMRMDELNDNPIPGRFNLKHLQRIHHRIFQDVYPWAGELRTAPRDWAMVKTGPDVAAVRATARSAPEIPHAYFTAREVPQAATAALDRIAAKDNLRSMSRNQFINELTKIWARVNYVHPFREGNTRTQFAFFRQLSSEAGYVLDTERFRDGNHTKQNDNSPVGDLREQFVWGRFEYMQTGDLRLMRGALDAAIIEAPGVDHGATKSAAAPTIERDFDANALSAAPTGHVRSASAMMSGCNAAPSAAEEHDRVNTERSQTRSVDAGYEV